MPDFTADQQRQAALITGAGMPSLEANAVVTAIKNLAISTGSSVGTNTFAGIVVTGTGTISNLRAATAVFGTASFTGTATAAAGIAVGNGNPVNLNGAAGAAKFVVGLTTNALRWQFGVNSDTESGGDAGSSWILNRYNDSGNYSGTPLTVNRATGAFTFAGTCNFVSGAYTGTTAISSAATAGFLWIPSGVGAPTGAPTPPYTNAVALYFDVAGTALYARVGTAGWARFGTS
jgi:hypothetical protein